MADDTNPFQSAFEFQRQTIEGSQRALTHSLEFQRQLNRAMLSGLESGADMNERGAETTRETLHQTLDVIEQLVPESAAGIDQVRTAIDGQFDAASEAGQQAVEAAESSVEGLEDASASYLETVDKQLEMLLAVHEDFESQTLSFLEETERQLEGIQREAESQVDEQVERLQQRIRQLRDQLIEES
ncbi:MULTISPECIES: hypothetical protein [Haloarcula]|uniref:hypothetical protein n=1 Tax=Haloarcula TaxID=2237 RepID=UPI0023ECF97C|nr:hypothetical protein [Halomicroarcula sp. XH51]